jgi:hypothetical protein
MSTKREERKQRAELARQTQTRRQRQRVMKSRVLVALGAAAVLAVGVMLARRDPKAAGGLVWSPEHGQWHNK